MQTKLSKNAIILILSKLKSVFDTKTDTELADRLGVKQNTLSSWKSRGAIDFMSIIAKCDNVDLNWLFDERNNNVDYFQYENSKKGVQLECTPDCIPDCTQTKTPEKVYNEHLGSPDADRPGVQYKLTMRGYGIAAEPRATYKTDRDFSLRTDRPIDMQRVPLYDLNASAGLVGLFIDSSHQAPVDYISIPGLPRCDGAVHVCGDSMYPLLKSGDIVIYKEVNDIINNIFWGEMYMVSFDVDGEEYIAIKYVQRSDDSEYIRLVSYNTHHSPQDIKLSRVRALAIIKASVRFNTMG